MFLLYVVIGGDMSSKNKKTGDVVPRVCWVLTALVYDKSGCHSPFLNHRMIKYIINFINEESALTNQPRTSLNKTNEHHKEI